MRNLLRIDASLRMTDSHSRRQADYWQERWQKSHPDGHVVRRDLGQRPIPHLEVNQLIRLTGEGDATADTTRWAESDELIAELKTADDVMISSPCYNFSLPSSLKAWLDHVIRYGHTVAHSETGPRGLLLGKRACVITARGGTEASSPDHQWPTLRAALAYMGISDTTHVGLTGTKIPDGQLEARITGARAQIDALFTSGSFA